MMKRHHRNRRRKRRKIADWAKNNNLAFCERRSNWDTQKALQHTLMYQNRRILPHKLPSSPWEDRQVMTAVREWKTGEIPAIPS